MALIPIFSSVCDLANRFPNMIAEFLDIEQDLKRRFREDSITDILSAALLTLPGNDIVVLAPQEAKTGGDFDLVIVDERTSEAIQFRIQAKRLVPHKHNWKIGSYPELAHPHNSGKQSATLLRGLGREAIPTIPLYAFYNPAHVCRASSDRVSGIELACGWEIRERIKTIVRVKPKRLPYKRIGSLQPLFFPLSTILCASNTDTKNSLIPSPSGARAAVVKAITEKSNYLGLQQHNIFPAITEIAGHSYYNNKSIKKSRGELTQSHDFHHALPTSIQKAMEYRSERIIKLRVKRPKIVFFHNE